MRTFARYFGMEVEILQKMAVCSLIKLGVQLFIVDTADLKMVIEVKQMAKAA